MPLITSSYKASGFFRNGHFATIYSAKIRPKIKSDFERERLQFDDGDFMDIDWVFNKNSHKVAILLHGLEGNANRIYMNGQSKVLSKNGWNVAHVNYRGCSGVPNMLFESYNAGKTDDLKVVIDYILQKDMYSEIALIGFSLGGNLLLKYLGEGRSIPKEINKSIAISSPLSLKGSLESLTREENWVYRTSFMHDLRTKYRLKMKQFPEKANKETLKKMTSILEFDHHYTAPAHGFVDAFDYYAKNSSLQFLPYIDQKVLILNALNDSFLSPDCYPFQFASNSQNVYLETPKHGGHVGFYKSNEEYYSEARALEFLHE